METPENQFQRRACVGDRYFILADLTQPDCWAIPGSRVIVTDADGHRRFAPARTVSTEVLQAWAIQQGYSFSIEEKFPVIRRGITEAIAA